MHPAISEALARQRVRDAHSQAREARLARAVRAARRAARAERAAATAVERAVPAARFD